MDRSKKLEIMTGLVNTAIQLKSPQGQNDTIKRSMWNQEVESALKEIFEDGVDKSKKFNSIRYNLTIYTSGTTKNDMYDAYARGVDQAIGYLRAWKKEIEQFHTGHLSNNEGLGRLEMSNECFIVHGHNDLMKLQIKEFIEECEFKTSLTPIILHKKPNEGKTIIEKFELHSDVDFAICIWSADDEGKSLNEETLKKRVRQNVIIETGFFWGKLGRDRVIILLEDGVEIPSDYTGMLYIPMKDNWKDELRKGIGNIYK